MVAPKKNILSVIYRRLYQKFGPQSWWPATTRFEVIVGAILTQNTNWSNVEKALKNLKQKNLLTPRALYQLPQDTLAALIKPAGYFNVKAKRLKHFLTFFFSEYEGSLARMQEETTPVLREKLLNVNGIGPETADSILLYALDRPVFVVDAYTKRFLMRHNMIFGRDGYHQMQDLFTGNLKPHSSTFNEYHALIVRLGKEFCRTKPRCEDCPLHFLNNDKNYRRYKIEQTPPLETK